MERKTCGSYARFWFQIWRDRSHCTERNNRTKPHVSFQFTWYAL